MLEYRTTSVYDAVLPLGGGCPISFQLAHRGKRLFATPLDWTLIPDRRGIDYLPTGIRTDFKDLLRRENLIVCAKQRVEKGRLTWSYEDTLSGFQFVHHFHGDIADFCVYDHVWKVHTRRLRRMLDFIESNKRILFVLNTKFEFDTEAAVRIYDALEHRFARTQVQLLVMQFNANHPRREEVRPGLVVERFARPINDVYDMTMTTAEWEFLDWIELPGRDSPNRLRKRSFRIKVAYKIWKSLGKWLAHRNAGCLGIGFRTFGEKT